MIAVDFLLKLEERVHLGNSPDGSLSSDDNLRRW